MLLYMQRSLRQSKVKLRKWIFLSFEICCFLPCAGYAASRCRWQSGGAAVGGLPVHWLDIPWACQQPAVSRRSARSLYTEELEPLLNPLRDRASEAGFRGTTFQYFASSESEWRVNAGWWQVYFITAAAPSLTNVVFQRLRATYTWHLLWTAPMLASIGTARAIQRSSNVALWSGWRAGAERPWLRYRIC